MVHLVVLIFAIGTLLLGVSMYQEYKHMGKAYQAPFGVSSCGWRVPCLRGIVLDGTLLLVYG